MYNVNYHTNIAKEKTMSQANNTSISVGNKHLKLRERYRIETLLKEKIV